MLGRVFVGLVRQPLGEVVGQRSAVARRHRPDPGRGRAELAQYRPRHGRDDRRRPAARRQGRTLSSPAVPLMQQGYIDVATTYDALRGAPPARLIARSDGSERRDESHADILDANDRQLDPVVDQFEP